MKKFLKLLSAVTAAAAALALTFSASAADFGSVTVMGDSIATGYGLEGYASGDNYSAAGSFGSIISESCGGYTNLAVDGRTTSELLSALQGEFADAVVRSDKVIISIGGNDYLQPMIMAAYTKLSEDTEMLSQIMSGELDATDMTELMKPYFEEAMAAASAVEASAVAANIKSITDEIAYLNSDCEVYLFTIYDPFEAGGDEMAAAYSLAETKLTELNAEITAMEGGNIHVIDVYGAFKGHAAEYTNITSGDIHPSAAGHAVIADLLTNELSGSAAASDTYDAELVPEKTSPDTGAERTAVVIGAAALAGAAVIFLGKKSRR
ncbi:MAG: SGNH/GDSL hydrolase family protein [Oscillospiraceae bacterium]